MKCPLCQKEVIPDEDKKPEDFHCPTYVYVYPSTRWCHYWAISTASGYQITATIPPFAITWLDRGGSLKIQQIKDGCPLKTIHQASEVKKEDLLRIYQRFQNLRAFS